MLYVTLLTIVHLALCLFLIGAVLLQQGKGADAGAVFGSANNSLFGAAGSNVFMTKLTTTVAVLFMVTSVLLIRAYSDTSLVPTVAEDLVEGSVVDQVATEAAPVAAAPDAATTAGGEAAPAAASAPSEEKSETKAE